MKTKKYIASLVKEFIRFFSLRDSHEKYYKNLPKEEKESYIQALGTKI